MFDIEALRSRKLTVEEREKVLEFLDTWEICCDLHCESGEWNARILGHRGTGPTPTQAVYDCLSSLYDYGYEFADAMSDTFSKDVDVEDDEELD